MDNVPERLVSALDSFLQISSLDSADDSLDSFAASWETLYAETTEKHAHLAYSVAGAIDVVCETLLKLSVAEDRTTTRLKEEHTAVKAQHIRTVEEAPSPIVSPSPSREASPIGFSSWSRRATNLRSPSPVTSTARPKGGQDASAPAAGLEVEETTVQISSSRTTPVDVPITLSRQPILSPLLVSTNASTSLPSPAMTESNDFSSSASLLQDAPAKSNAVDGVSHIPILSRSEIEEGSDSEYASTVSDATADVIRPRNAYSITPPATPSRSPSPGSLPSPGKIATSVTLAFIQPLLTRVIQKPYNLYPSKTLISEIALSSATSEKDINAYLSQLRSKLGWNGIRKKYFPPAQWSITQMLAWLDGYWEYTHSEMPSLKDYDVYMGATGIGGTMRGLDVRLTILHDGLKGIYDRMTGREGEGSDVGKAIKEGVKWSSKHEWEKKKKELEKQGEALRKAQGEEERSLKRKFVEDEDHDGEEVARQIPRPRVVSAPQPQSKKRSRSESPESEDDGDLTPPPPAKRHCSLPTMSLSTPTNLENWFKVQTPMPTWDAPVTLKAFSYDAMPMPSLVDDDSDSERGSSVGPSTPDSSEYVDLPAFDFSTLVQPVEYGGMPKPFELNVHTLPDVAFPELLNAQNLNMGLFAAAPSSGKDLPSSDQFVSIPTSDEAPFDFGDPQSWSFNYDGLDLGSMGFDLNFGVDGV